MPLQFDRQHDCDGLEHQQVLHLHILRGEVLQLNAQRVADGCGFLLAYLPSVSVGHSLWRCQGARKVFQPETEKTSRSGPTRCKATDTVLGRPKRIIRTCPAMPKLTPYLDAAVGAAAAAAAACGAVKAQPLAQPAVQPCSP